MPIKRGDLRILGDDQFCIKRSPRLLERTHTLHLLICESERFQNTSGLPKLEMGALITGDCWMARKAALAESDIVPAN